MVTVHVDPCEHAGLDHHAAVAHRLRRVGRVLVHLRGVAGFGATRSPPCARGSRAVEFKAPTQPAAERVSVGTLERPSHSNARVRAKRRDAARLGSVALRADATQTQLCTYLSVVVLLGLAANALLGEWWMDPVAGLVVAGLAVRESDEAWISDDQCDC
jgi:hypothetical protein